MKTPVCKLRDGLLVMLNYMICNTLKLNTLYIVIVISDKCSTCPVKCKFLSWVQMVAKQNSSLVLQTEGQVMAERPKNNCCFATPNRPWNETPLLSFLKLSFQYKIVTKSTYKIFSHSVPEKNGNKRITSQISCSQVLFLTLWPSKKIYLHLKMYH